jgi:hypothetical protein
VLVTLQQTTLPHIPEDMSVSIKALEKQASEGKSGKVFLELKYNAMKT